MKNTFGNAITVTLFGESHGSAIGAVLDGLAPGIKIDKEYIAAKLEQRKAKGKISTKRQEADEFKILSGVFNGYTTGTPLAIIIENKDVRSADYDTLGRMARPSHADLTAHFFHPAESISPLLRHSQRLSLRNRRKERQYPFFDAG